LPAPANYPTNFGSRALVGDSIIERIATAIAEIDFFLALVSMASHESNWCRKELALAITGELGRDGTKVLPLRVDGASMPESLRDVYYLTVSHGTLNEVADKIAAAVVAHRKDQDAHAKPPRDVASGGVPTSPTPMSAPSPSQEVPIRITGIVEEGVGQPRNDGTRGSAMYRVPLQLSRRPSPLWSQVFIETWNHPPSYSSMHRPGIASVSGDTIVLDGTTMDELGRYHIETLRGVLAETNQRLADIEAERQVQSERVEDRRREHRQDVRDIASRLKFD
jgi:hypothetical protein